MGKPGAFLKVGRKEHELRPVSERTKDFSELYNNLSAEGTQAQASRCMACGVPFCQAGVSFGKARPSGCPLHNLIPEWNDLVYRGQWQQACERLALTSPMPEFTSRVCPALCEAACNLGQRDAAVCIHDNERAISDWQWAHGGPAAFEPAAPSAPKVCVVGSGPAGLVCAWELARAGLNVCVVEHADAPGGLLMYGIPNMKLDKAVVSRRVELMSQLGIEFRLNTNAANAQVASELAEEFDAVVLAVGARAARGVAAAGFDEGVKAGGVVYAVDYLTAATKAVLAHDASAISAKGKNVVVIGGGDTGNDCMGTAVRQGAKSVRQLEYGPCPPEARKETNAWPEWPNVKKTDYGQQEAIELNEQGDLREWCANTTEVLFDEAGNVSGITVETLDWSSGKPAVIEGSKREIEADLVLVACGFSGPRQDVFDAFGVEFAASGRPLPKTVEGSHKAQLKGAGEQPSSADANANGTAAIYVAGDARTGSSLVVNAMADAIAAAKEVVRGLGA